MNEFCRCQTALVKSAFTEHGAIMAATVFHIVLAFTMRQYTLSPSAIAPKVHWIRHEKGHPGFRSRRQSDASQAIQHVVQGSA
jgi:hypothetical protein